MALPLPALTFEQTAIFTPASTSPTNVLLAIQAAFADLSVNVWTTARAKGEDASNPGIRITAPSGSPISNFNAILGALFSNSGYTRASARDYHQTATYENTYRGPLYLAIGPDGYDDGTAPATWFGGANAFGTGNRESGYWGSTDTSGTDVSAITQVWIVASAETCAICFRYSADNNCAFIYFGAIVEGVNAANVEADDRIYGMCVPGNNQTQPMDATWSYTARAQADEQLAHFNSANFCHAGVFDPTSVGAASFPSTISKRGTGTASAQRIVSSLSFDGGIASSPLQAWLVRNFAGGSAAPVYSGYAGALRGVYYTTAGVARSVLLDTSAAAQGYRMSGSLVTATYDACVFGNG
jgi:hypothetical protein